MGRGPLPLLRSRKPPNLRASVTSSSGRAGLVFVQVSLKKSCAADVIPVSSVSELLMDRIQKERPHA